MFKFCFLESLEWPGNAIFACFVGSLEWPGNEGSNCFVGFFEWLRMGSPKLLMKDEERYISNTAYPKFDIIIEKIVKNYETYVNLGKNEVVLIELAKIKD